MGGLLGRTSCHLLDDLTLVVDDTFHQFGIGLVAHGFVAIATHTDGHDILCTFHALNTLTEELVQLLLIGLIVPCTPFATITCILLVVARHRLMVRGAHHDTHAVGQFAVLGVVGIKCPSPHGGPHHISLEAQDEFKDLLIEMMVAIVGAKGVLDP